MMADKRYYWLKLKNDFFKRHDIKIIEGMPNGKDYILFYLKLLVESVSHDGELRFSETIPYNEEMLATITNTNIDIVRSAMKIFTQLGMIDVLENSTIYMCEVNKMLGSESWSAERVRRLRTKEKQVALQCNTNETSCNVEKEIELELEIELDKDKEKNIKKRKFAPSVTLSDEEYQKLCDKVDTGYADECITVLSNYKLANGKKYKSDYHAILNWVCGKVSAYYQPKPVIKTTGEEIKTITADEIDSMSDEEFFA